jgi:putative pre-16S rRNA nuclease
MGVDLGTKRTGVAVSVEGIAQPHAVLDEQGDELVGALAALAQAEGVSEIVVGDPIRLDGTAGEPAERARELAAALGRTTGLPVALWDERMTTVVAERSLVGAGVRRRRRRTVVDKVAAAVMLQSYLDANRSRP